MRIKREIARKREGENKPIAAKLALHLRDGTIEFILVAKADKTVTTRIARERIHDDTSAADRGIAIRKGLEESKVIDLLGEITNKERKFVQVILGSTRRKGAVTRPIETKEFAVSIGHGLAVQRLKDGPRNLAVSKLNKAVSRAGSGVFVADDLDLDHKAHMTKHPRDVSLVHPTLDFSDPKGASRGVRRVGRTRGTKLVWIVRGEWLSRWDCLMLWHHLCRFSITNRASDTPMDGWMDKRMD